MAYTLGAFTVDQLAFIQQVPASVLAAAAAGALDLNRLAREELASRGLDQMGMWVGFERAKQLLPLHAPVHATDQISRKTP